MNRVVQIVLSEADYAAKSQRFLHLYAEMYALYAQDMFRIIEDDLLYTPLDYRQCHNPYLSRITLKAVRSDSIIPHQTLRESDAPIIDMIEKQIADWQLCRYLSALFNRLKQSERQILLAHYMTHQDDFCMQKLCLKKRQYHAALKQATAHLMVICAIGTADGIPSYLKEEENVRAS